VSELLNEKARRPSSSPITKPRNLAGETLDGADVRAYSFWKEVTSLEFFQ
jgi:hypothetical protein